MIKGEWWEFAIIAASVLVLYFDMLGFDPQKSEEGDGGEELASDADADGGD